MNDQILIQSDTAMEKAKRQPTEVFLLNPANRDFLSGKSRRIADRIVLPAVLPFIGVLPLILIGFWGMIQFVKAVSETSVLSQPSAAIVTGEIVGRRTSRGKSTSYFVTYRFYDSMQVYQREQMVGAQTHTRLKEGLPVTVRYIPTDPMISSLGGDDTDNAYLTGLIIAMVIFVPFVSIMIAVFYRAVQRLRPKFERRQRLEREGKLLRGEVVSCEGRVERGSYMVTLRFSFRSLKGHEMVKAASRKRNDLKKADLPQQGTPVAILYLNSKNYVLL